MHDSTLVETESTDLVEQQICKSYFRDVHSPVFYTANSFSR